MKHYFLGLLSVFLILSCSDKVEEKGARKILKNAKGGDFRGVNIGDNLKTVVGNEDAISVYNMPDELIYRIESDGEDSTWYEISYNFTETGLYHIRLDIFPKSKNYLGLYKEDFVNYYNQKYGDCTTRNGYCEWKVMTNNGHFVNITLTDSLIIKSRPCLKVVYSENDE